MLEAKTRVLDNLVASMDANMSLLQTDMHSMHSMHISPDTDLHNITLPAQQTTASYNSVEAVIRESTTADKYTNSSGIPCSNAAHIAETSSPVRTALAENYIDSFRNGFRGLISKLAPVLLHLESDPDDSAALTQLQDLINRARLKFQQLRVFHRLPMSYI
eukprot:jgi/Chrzof1/439/Cz01g15270.t1